MKTNCITLSRVLSLFLGLALIAAALPVLAAPQAYYEEGPSVSPTAYASGEVLVKFKNSNVPFEVLEVPNVEEAVVALSKNPNVVFAEPNYSVTAFAVPNDPLYGYQWHFDNGGYGGIELEAAWDISTGLGVTVAVVDTGLALVEDKPDCILAGYNYVSGSTDTTDDNGHGTHVAGTIAQATNNGIGAAGIAHDACILPVKVLDANGSGWTDDVAEGIRFAADNGADVINLSLGSGGGSQVMEEAVAYAYSQGATVVAASGNDGQNQVSYPAAYDNYVIAVGATSYDEELASYSNYGSAQDIVAPGGEMYVYRGPFARDNDENGDGYVDGVLQNTVIDGSEANYFFQGTSMASPHVAGVAALVLANGNATTPDEVRAALEGSADDLGNTGRDDTFGHGIVNAHQALLWNGGGGEPVNQAPTAGAVATPSEVLVGETVTFDGTGSSDPDGDALNYDWTFSDGGTASGAIVTRTYATTGTYSATLTVSDGEFSDSATASVVVNEETVVTNNPPTADFSVATTDLLVAFTNLSSDPDGDAVTYAWDFGDGNTSTAENPSHTYSAAGTYIVSLTVSDDAGASDITSQSVTVTEQVASGIKLTLNGYKDKGQHVVTLNWNGATGENVDIKRDGDLLTPTATPNDGTYEDRTGNRGGATYTYQVCEAGSTDVCSDTATISF